MKRAITVFLAVAMLIVMISCVGKTIDNVVNADIEDSSKEESNSTVSLYEYDPENRRAGMTEETYAFAIQALDFMQMYVNGEIDKHMVLSFLFDEETGTLKYIRELDLTGEAEIINTMVYGYISAFKYDIEEFAPDELSAYVQLFYNYIYDK